MAKKKAVRGEFNMSAEIRALLKETPSMSSRDVFEELQKRFPGQTINRNSCNVAFSHARRKMGLRPGRSRSVKVRRPGAKAVAAPRGGEAVDFTLLKAARKFMAEAGSAQAAINALQQLEALQIG
ncbi:hypothetical protein [Planctomicrobium sp. SH664]|uniref:hypothetical protein n=1 Tax=Planctomicrobium sp. SH664 TaxID=3448125 RepID=UPI003F5C9985